MTNEARLQHFPISWFAMVMGLSGFTIAWMRAATLLGAPKGIGSGLLAVTISAFVILALLYTVKLVSYRSAVAAELNHPVKINFFPTVSIALILIGMATLDATPGVSKVLWSIGVVLHLLFTVYVMSVWINHTKFQIHHMNPAWFIPVVGNILVPIAGVHHYSPEISWFCFSIGLVFWIVLLTIVYYRVIFHDPLPDRLVPTMFILIAPPAVGFISYLSLVGEIDVFARILYYAGLFLTLLLLTQIRRFARLHFFLSWWAYSFPMAAITIATLLMFHKLGLPFFGFLSWFFLTLLTLIIVVLLIRTALAVRRREICVEES
ncbi:MAG TPA: SLAC1 anion channel family protein [Arenicellales bacterium]|nr:SLAC1 anion channel family protein [Arenicellales bacterium]